MQVALGYMKNRVLALMDETQAAIKLGVLMKTPMRSGLVLRQAYATGSYSLKEIGQAFGLNYTTVSLVVQAVETESEEG